MKKVYCEICKFNKSGWGIEYDTCRPYFHKPKKIKEEKDDYYSKYHLKKSIGPELKDMLVLNKDNNCLYYKKCKWWKF